MLPPYFEFQNPVRIISGRRALDNLPYELEQLGSKRPLIVTDPGVSKAGLAKYVIDAFAGSGMVIAGIYDQVPSDSSLKTVHDLAEAYRKNGCDCLVAVGGGSVIDSAKGANILVSEGVDDLRPFVGSDLLRGHLKPLVVIPTTSGTGSEVTTAAMVSDPEKDMKLAITSRYLVPSLAVLDPRMTLALPPPITAATAMDAMTHSMESHYCLQRNPLSDGYGWTAIRLISRYLIHVLENSRDEEGRLALANAACMAGVAFSNSMVGMVHAFGHAAGAVCHIPHGVTMNIFLPHGLEYNLSKASDLIGELLLPLTGSEVYAKTPGEQRASKTVETIVRLRERLHELTGMPYTLKGAGVSPVRFEEIVGKTLSDGAMMYNPTEVDREDALRVLQKAYE